MSRTPGMRLACRPLSSWFEKDATIVAPTPFLASLAAGQFSREQLRQGIETWRRPTILSLDAWLVACWHEVRYTAAGVPSLLSPAQERALWHSIIEQEHPQLFDVSATVRLARAAARLLAEWHISAEGELWNDHIDAQQFQHWNRLVRRKCRDESWVTRVDLFRQIPKWIADGAFRPTLTVFVGFDPTPPALESIENALGSLSVRVPWDASTADSETIARNCPDFASEIEFAARRLRLLFEADPHHSLALFVPELAEQHALVERTLHSVFFPSSAAKLTDAQSSLSETLFHVDQAGLLLDHPLVASAILFLNVVFPRINHADAGAILRSPFLKGAAAEKNQRALADIELRKRRELDVSLTDMERASRACPILSSCWQKLTDLIPKASQVCELSQWSEFFSNTLAALGWPGDTVLSQREEQILKQWDEQLSSLSSLGLVNPPVKFESAVGHLRRLLSIRLEHGDWSAPIHILDSTSAQGVQFDESIAVGLSEETWPPPLRISPLVPLKLQRLHQVPGATPQSARAQRLRLTQALFSTAPETLVTFNGRLATVAETFVKDKTGDPPAWDGRLPKDSFLVQTLQQIPDGQAPAFVARGELRGGTAIIKAQSQCPFRAFSEFRLQARSLEDASFGFDARERGGFVHKALEKVWQRLQTQAALRKIAPADLRLLVRESIAEAVQTKESGPLHKLSIDTERERLEEVMLDWLALEHARQEPFTVEMIEHARKFEVPGLSVQLRIDRIDRLNNGNLVLIDYKSGPQTRGKLEGERPSEPQLLVYAASADAPVDGIFFGQVKPRDVKAVGFSRVKHFKGHSVSVKADWQGYMEKAHQNVEKLANDFVRGAADVDPIKDACAYCASKPFCRVNERGGAQEDDE